jgi:hypothetical protein
LTGGKPPKGLLDEDGEKDRRIAELILDNQQLEEEANELFIEKVKTDWREANPPTFKKLPISPKHLNLLERRKRSQQNQMIGARFPTS